MMMSAGAASALVRLTATFDDPNVDLALSLKGFIDQVRLNIPSLLGASVEIWTGGARVDVVAMDVMPAAAVGSSLTIPAVAETSDKVDAADAGSRIELVLYAAAPGALVDLAADLGFLMSLPLSAFALDEHLDGPQRAGFGLDAVSLVDQAIGVLLDHGRTPEEAKRDIVERTGPGVSQEKVALAILAGLDFPPASPDPEQR